MNTIVLWLITFAFITAPPQPRTLTYKNPSTRTFTIVGTISLEAVDSIPEYVNTVIIKNSTGGYLGAIKKLQKYNVRVEGYCYSACFWLVVSSENVCFDLITTFKAHAWHVQSESSREKIIDTNETITYVLKLRQPVHGLLEDLPYTSMAIDVPGSIMFETYPDRVCIDIW